MNKVSKWKSDIAPRAMQKIRVNSVLAGHCSAIPDGVHSYRVHDSFGGWVHSINMDTHKCSCRYWQLNDIPCQHAMACARQYGFQPATLVSDYYSKDKYIKTYEPLLECTRGPEMWNDYAGEKIEAPVMKSKRGRPKVKRYKCRDEIRRVSKTKTVLSRKGITKHCTICKSESHNKRTCPNK